MRKSVIAIGFAIGVFVATSSAYANDNVAALLQQCNAEYASTDWFYCVGKVGGISDVMDLNGLLYSSGKGGTNLSPLSTCPNKPTLPYGARLQAFKNWAQIHPERWGDQDFIGVMTALREVWPCH
jgi:hypothetical protein